MAYRLIVKPGAELDIIKILEWYEKQMGHLAVEFLQRLDIELQRISKEPGHFQKRYRDIRIIFMKRFPYGIHYTFEGDTVYVHAVFHSKRRPRL